MIKFIVLLVVSMVIHSCAKQYGETPKKVNVSINGHLDGVISVSDPLDFDIEVQITFKLCFAGGSFRYETRNYIIKKGETTGRHEILPNVCSGKIVNVSCSNELYLFIY